MKILDPSSPVAEPVDGGGVLHIAGPYEEMIIFLNFEFVKARLIFPFWESAIPQIKRLVSSQNL